MYNITGILIIQFDANSTEIQNASNKMYDLFKRG